MLMCFADEDVMVQLPWKIVWRVLKNLKIELAYDPAIHVWVYTQKEVKVRTQTDICAPIFTAALFTVAKR